MTFAKVQEARLRQAVAALIGKRCWGVVAGEGTGSRFGLDLDGKVERATPLENPLLSPATRRYEAPYGLFVEGCPWRVQTATEVVGSWLDDNANDGPMVANLKRFVGAWVTEARTEPPAWDLRLLFDNGLTLCVFPDATGAADGQDNYSVFARSAILIVGEKSVLRSEPRVLTGPVLFDR